MIDYETYSRIKLYEKEGLNAGQIADKLSLDPRTVRQWLLAKSYHQRRGASKKSKLDPYKEEIINLLERHSFTATQIYQRISESGFQGGYTTVREYVRQVRPKRPAAFLSLAFAPGECAQVDWGIYKTIEVGSSRRKLNFFVMVLSHSRMIYVEFSLAQSMEHFLSCHQNAFEFFGGVPENIMIDNLKTGVIRRITGHDIIFNTKYSDFAQHYGFTIKACGVRKGNEKGRVENGVGYVKKNFLNGLEIPQFEALNPGIKTWMDTIANVRIHGETRQKPIDLWQEDINTMRPLPLHRYDIARIQSVRATKLFRITLDTNRYSVPAEYASQPLTLKIYPDRLCIYYQEKLIARHSRSFDRHLDIEDPDHPKELLAQRRKSQEQKIFQRFIALSSKAGEYYKKLEHKRLNARIHVRKIVGLSEIYGVDETARAMEDSFIYDAFSSEYIANILEQQKNRLPEPSALHLTRNKDLLSITLDEPDLSIYHSKTIKRSRYDN